MDREGREELLEQRGLNVQLPGQMATGRRADSDRLCLGPPCPLPTGKFNEMKKFVDPFFSGECLSLPFREDFLKT